VSKKLLDERLAETQVKRAYGRLGTGTGYSGSYAAAEPVIVEEDIPITIEVEEFQYTYKCKHCGHVWTELHEKEQNVGTTPR
jgi:hypothetical protein